MRRRPDLVVMLFALVVGMNGLGSAQETARKTSFPLSAVDLPQNSPPIQVIRFERLNAAIEELEFVYQEFFAGKADLTAMLKASDRVADFSREALTQQSALVSFAARHFVVVEAIEREVQSRRAQAKASDQEVRLAKIHRLSQQIQLLKPSEPNISVTLVPKNNNNNNNPPNFAQPAPANVFPPSTPPTNGPPPRNSRPTNLAGTVLAKPDLSVLGPPLKDADAGVLEKVKHRVLDIRSHASLYEFGMSDDGKTAVVVEAIDDKNTRFALWNLDDGKLVRYLAAVEGSPTKPYTGKDDADHGVETTMSGRGVRKFAFSPDGKTIAALTQIAAPELGPNKTRDDVMVWETATGKLLRTVVTLTNHHPHTFFFVDPTQIVTKAFGSAGVSLELIDVSSGAVDYLIKDVRFEMYGGSVRNGLVPFAAPGGDMFAIKWKTREQVNYDRPPAGSSNFAADRTWFSTDGKFLFARKHGVLQSWDAETMKFLQETKLTDDRSVDLMLVAEDAGLIARRRNADRKIEFYDAKESQVTTAVVLPYRRVDLPGISADAKRLAVATDDRKLLVVDFPDGLPKGTVSLVKGATEAAVSPQR